MGKVIGKLVLRKLGKVLLVEADSFVANSKSGFLRENGTVVEVVSHEFQVLTRLEKPDHGYNFVFLGNRPLYPDMAKQMVLGKKNIFE